MTIVGCEEEMGKKVSEMKAMRRSSGFVEKDNREVNDKHNYADNKEKNVFTHKSLPFVFSDSPYIDHQSQDSRAYIEVEKRHDFALDMPDNFTAMLKNSAVKAAPAVNVNQGVLLTAPGTNTPTTSDANKSFAPSRKKSEIISKPSLCSMLQKFTTQAVFCQGGTLYAVGNCSGKAEEEIAGRKAEGEIARLAAKPLAARRAEGEIVARKTEEEITQIGGDFREIGSCH